MKILVTGASGMLGRAVAKRLSSVDGWSVVGVCNSRIHEGLRKCDLLDGAATIALLDEVRPDAIVHAAAIRRPDEYAADEQRAEALNVGATETLAGWGAPYLLYISSDYVFDGRSAPYAVDAATNPVNAYGKSKLAGEEAVRWLASGRAAVLRIPVLYTLSPENLAESSVTSVAEQVLKRGPCVLDDWAARYPTLVEDVAEVIAQMVASRLVGTFHWTSGEMLTKYDMGMVVADVMGLDKSLLRRSGAPANGTAARPRDCHLDRSLLEAHGIRANGIKFADAMRRILNSGLPVVKCDDDGLERAATVLNGGGVAVIPTDTVYGLAASPKFPEAVDRLYTIKGRDARKPIALLAADAAAVEGFGFEVKGRAAELAEAHWPGGLTMVIGAEGFRVPDHDWTRRLLRKCGGVLRVTSANLSGHRPATDAPAALADVGLSADVVVDDGVSRGGVPSTVVRVLDDGGVEVLRKGGVEV